MTGTCRTRVNAMALKHISHFSSTIIFFMVESITFISYRKYRFFWIDGITKAHSLAGYSWIGPSL